MMGLAVLVSLLVVVANAALVARYVVRWDRRGGPLPADAADPATQQPPEVRRTVRT